MDEMWAKVVDALKGAPGWLWGALAGLGALTAGVLRLRSANARADAAEKKAVEANLARDTAQADATVREKTERIEQLAEERKQVRAEGDDRVAEALDMDDEETISWLQKDAAARRKKNEP